MRLRDFRAHPSIPGHEQLYFVNEPRFPKETGAHPVIRPHVGRWRRFFARRFNRTLLDLPNRDGLLFIGRTDRSWEDKAQLDSFFRCIAARPRRRHVVLIGKSDIELDAGLLARLPSNVLGLIGNNVSVRASRLHYVPMGRDFRSREAAVKATASVHPETLVYCNFSVNTHPDRERVHDLLRDKSAFIRFEHMGAFRQYALTREDFFLHLGNSKFAVCPRGNGIDTFRMWDCLALGVVPIVVREAAFHDELSDLPILFLDSINDFASLSPEFLEQSYARMMETTWNYQKLTLSFWIRRIQTLCSQLLQSVKESPSVNPIAKT